MSYPFIMQGKNLVVVIDNNPHTISPSHLFYEKIIDAVKSKQWDSVREMVEPKKAVVEYSNGNITIKEDTLYWQGQDMHNSICSRMVEMLKEGFDIDSLVQFMHNLMQNPSNRAVNELYGFLEKNNLPITPDGHFLAYKKVREDFYDVYSGSVLNKPANMMTDEDIASLPEYDGNVTVNIENGVTVVSMERNKVDDDRNRTCSHGLHFCSMDYLRHFGGERIVIVKINPRDVVSIPSDYNDSKGRACRYEVISELGVSPEQAFTKGVQEDANQPEEFEEDFGFDEFGEEFDNYDNDLI